MSRNHGLGLQLPQVRKQGKYAPPRCPLRPLWFCLLSKGMKVFTLQKFCWFKDCGLNKIAVADSWFTLTAASAPSLGSQFSLGPKWQLWSRRAITMFPQFSAKQPQADTTTSCEPWYSKYTRFGRVIWSVVRKTAGITKTDKTHTYAHTLARTHTLLLCQKQRYSCRMPGNKHFTPCLW